jgi:glycosyltransferase involved in cell wall biosynthesis
MAKILIVHNGEGQIRGAERVMLMLVDSLRAAHTFHVVTDHAGLHGEIRDRGIAGELWAFPGAWSERLTLRRLRTMSEMLFRFTALIRREGIEAIHVSNGHYSHLVVLPALITGVPFLAHLHSALSKRTQLLFGIFAADRIVSVAKFINRAWDEHPRIARKCMTIYNAVTTEEPPPLQTDRARLGIAADAYVVVVASVLSYAKGVDVAIQAIAQLARQDRQVHLLLLGDGPDRAALEAMASGLPVTFAGYRSDARAIFTVLADAMVLPTTTTEAHSIALLEAGLAGIPRIASTIGGNPESIDDGHDGLLFRAGDANDLAEKIERLRADPERAAEFVRNARERIARQFSHEVFCRAFDTLYSDLIRQRRGALRRIGDIAAMPWMLLRRKLARRG